MKQKDSDSTQEYKATTGLGNPSTAAAGDAKELRENMHETPDTNKKKITTWKEAISTSLNNLHAMESKAKDYKQLVEDIAESLCIVEESLTSEEVVKAVKEAIDESENYHVKKLEFYKQIRSLLVESLNA